MSAVHGARGIVATSQRLASEVGASLLRQGGSAIDAALGANAMLSLIEPHMCGPGGDLFAQVWDARSARLYGLNASGRAPQGQSLAALQAKLRGAAAIPAVGPLSITVPGAVRGWAALYARFGRLPLDAIYAPVIEHAECGVEIGPATAIWWQQTSAALLAAPQLAGCDTGLRTTFWPAGRAPRAGEWFKNAALAATYRRLVARGFDDFYTGTLSNVLARYLTASGSAITAADLAATSAEWVQPISTTYRGYEVCELPPNGQGLSVLEMLNVLEHFPLDKWGMDSVDYRHVLLEAKKLAFEDRARFYADPEFADVPVAALASKAYARERVLLIGAHANFAPRHGAPAIAHGDTTYLAVADRDGMMVSLIQSVFHGFGSGLVPADLGFPLQCRGAGFSLEPRHANVYAPGKRPFHTIMPAFILKDRAPLMAFGVMGGDVQPQGQVQILVNQIDFGLDVHAAGAAARVRHDGMNSPSVSRSADGGVTWFETGVPDATIEALRERGHELRPASDPVQHFMGGYQCVRRVDGGYVAASETRFDGCAVAE